MAKRNRPDSIFDDVASYEAWLSQQGDVVKAGLKKKHKKMRESPFSFLRATCFRWARTIESVCPGFSDAPQLLCVGDMHIENFGTWRDAQGRLVWGVNDFDEAATTPYAYDLIRLVTSARLAPGLNADAAGAGAAAAILKGYRDGLDKPRPALLDEDQDWIRPLVAGRPKASESFWDDFKDKKKSSNVKPPAAVQSLLLDSLPEGARKPVYKSIAKGGGSLGRPRFQVLAEWQGGRVVREAKALVPSAWDWARGTQSAGGDLLALAFGPYRSPDPQLRIVAGFVLRRIAPDAHKVEWSDVSKKGLGKLLRAMGADLGAIHAASGLRKSIQDDLRKRDRDWLHRAAMAAERAVRRDYAAYKKPGR